ARPRDPHPQPQRELGELTGKGGTHLRPLNPIMFCTTDSLSSAISAVSRTRSAQSSHIFLALPSTLMVTSLSASFSHSLQVAITISFFPGGRGNRTLSYE